MGMTVVMGMCIPVVVMGMTVAIDLVASSVVVMGMAVAVDLVASSVVMDLVALWAVMTLAGSSACCGAAADATAGAGDGAGAADAAA